MKKILILLLLLLIPISSEAVVPIIFTNGTVADATEVNQNFDYFEIKFSPTGGHDHDGSDAKTITLLGTITTGVWQGTIVDQVYGGTGLSSYSTGDLIHATADAVLARLLPGTAGKFLQSQGADTKLSYEKVDLADNADTTGTLAEVRGGTGVTSGVMIEGDSAGGDLTGTYPDPGIKASNVIFAWSGNESYAANDYGINISTTRDINLSGTDSAGFVNYVNNTNVFKTFLRFKFKKTAGINTITMYVRLWSRQASATDEAFVNVDIGGASNSVKSITSTTPTWKNADINVSGLTDGVVYDGIVQLKNETTSESYFDAVTLIGS